MSEAFKYVRDQGGIENTQLADAEESGEKNTPFLNSTIMRLKLKQNEQERNATRSLYTSPQHQNVMQCTEQVTKCIQALCKCLLTGSGREDCVVCAENIRYAVTNLISALQMVSQLLECTFF